MPPAPADPTAFEVWAQIVVPSLLGLATLVVAIASLVVSTSSHRWGRVLTAAQLQDREDAQRVELSEAMTEWRSLRSEALALGLDHDEYESTALAADLALAVTLHVLQRSGLPVSNEMLLLLQYINDDTERAASEPTTGLLARYNIALEIAPIMWRADPLMLTKYIKTLDSILRPEGAVAPSDDLVELMTILRRRWNG